MTIAAPFILVIVIASIVMMWFVRRKSVLSNQTLEWLESECRGIINTKFSSILDGLITSRVYKRQEYFLDSYIKESDKVSSVSFSFYGVNAWFWAMVEYIGFIVASLNIFSVFFLKLYTNFVSDLFLSLSVLMSTPAISSISFLFITYLNMENQIKLVKNSINYTKIRSEPVLNFENDPEDWPMTGKIVFKDVTLKYPSTKNPALNGVNIEIEDAENVGIQGLTGSGKSSFINCLFRLYELTQGKIEIDGYDISKIGLHCLRRNISYIPQTPFLMVGTVRENLDPHEQYDDEAIIQALDTVQLWAYVQQFKDGLKTELAQGNKLFSTGQKQLICLARAVLAKNKIIALDEATAKVDYETDEIIHSTIRKNFKN